VPERRRFSERERAALYLAADGRCSWCGAELLPGWHADHEVPWSRGGPTDVVNGQALCPDCNREKAARVTHADRFQPRPFQHGVIHAVLDGIASGRSTTIALASPGSGKTLAYQAAATFAHREGRLDYVAAFVPRIILAQQCETSWRHTCPAGHCKAEKRDAVTGLAGYHVLFSPNGRLGAIRHIRNSLPLLPPGERGIGFVTTYASLVVGPDIYESWARQHAGRFLLVADEAQFCGVSNDELPKVAQLRHPKEDSQPAVAKRMGVMRVAVEVLLREEIKPAAEAVHAGPGRGHKTDCATIGLEPDRADTIVARLKRDDPALAARVVNGEITANAAARQKGWRRPRIVVSSPESVAASLRRHMTADDLARLAALLVGEDA